LAAHDVAPNSIIIAPAMHEGLDLADDLSRFQIICKIPFPNFHQDKQLAVRMESDPVFYDWITALKLVQSAGRSVRSKTDWADTYILDGSFEWWFRKNKRLLPSWFTEAIIDGP
jgi:Rad3-related DNA helicase